MATLIGLCIRTKLLRSLPPRFKVDILVRAAAAVTAHQPCLDGRCLAYACATAGGHSASILVWGSLSHLLPIMCLSLPVSNHS